MLNRLQSLMKCTKSLALLMVLTHSVWAQKDLNPADIFLKVYYFEKDGQKHMEAQNYELAIKKFGMAQSKLQTIHLNFPGWNPAIVEKAHKRVTALSKNAVHLKAGNKTNSGALSLYQAVSYTHLTLPTIA